MLHLWFCVDLGAGCAASVLAVGTDVVYVPMLSYHENIISSPEHSSPERTIRTKATMEAKS
jgi:hypothetical protein